MHLNRFNGEFFGYGEDSDFEGRPDALETLINDVVEEQLLSDVPVGLFLSGGLDSSVVASSIAACGGATAGMTALTVGFPGNAAADESPVARRTAEALGLNCETLHLSDNTQSYYKGAVSALDEPLGFSAIVTQTAIAQLASEAGLKVVLTGDGGDEAFGGYRWYNQTLDEKQNALIKAAKGRSPNDIRFPFFQRKAMHRAKIAALIQNRPHVTHARSLFPALRPDQASHMFARLAAVPIVDLIEDALGRHDAPRLPEKRRRQRIDLYTFCQDAILTKVDRACMASSVEARPPLLDHRIIEHGLSMPISDAYDAAPKNALRTIARKRGLGFLLDEPKRGFSLRSKHRHSRFKMRKSITELGPPLALEKHWAGHLKDFRGDRTELDVLYFLATWHARLPAFPQ